MNTDWYWPMELLFRGGMILDLKVSGIEKVGF
jgi:hypothetical protein